MSTAREARIQAAEDAVETASDLGMMGLNGSEVTRIANAVVDAFFPPDPLIDQAKVPGPLTTSEGPEIDG
jgi:hypothetical protein